MNPHFFSNSVSHRQCTVIILLWEWLWFIFLNLFRLNAAEMGFLAEYTAVMKPVAMARYILQGKSSVHMLSTLYQLLEKLRRLSHLAKCVEVCWYPAGRDPETFRGSDEKPWLQLQYFKIQDILDHRGEHLNSWGICLLCIKLWATGHCLILTLMVTVI